jgi:hypothetical protein
VARIRTIKPDFFRHGRLFEAEQAEGLPLRVAYAGLWTVADREGRFKWDARALKLDCLPYDDVDFGAVLAALDSRGFVVHYTDDDGKEYGFIPSWKEHQVVNTREAQSSIPPPSEQAQARARTCNPTTPANLPSGIRETVLARDGRCVRCGGHDDLTVDHIFPRCMGGTNALPNLRILCRSCNSARPVAGKALIDDLAADGLTLNDMQRICMHAQNQGEGKGKERKGTRVATTIEVPAWVPMEAWERFDEFRRKRDKAAWTDNARKLAIGRLEKLRGEGNDPGEVLDQAVLRNWSGLFPVRGGAPPSSVPGELKVAL